MTGKQTIHRFSFYFGALGMAFGLGNLWRFPYVVAENGGGAFVYLYIFMVTIIGVPLLIGELIIGKASGKNIVGALKEIGGRFISQSPDKEKPIAQFKMRQWLIVGALLNLLCIFVLAYFSIISGWVIHFFNQYLFALIRPHTFLGVSIMDGLLEKGWLQLLLASVHMIFTCILVQKSWGRRLDRIVGFTTPLFAGLIVWLVFKSLGSENAAQAIQFFLYPDFKKLTLSSLAAALGQMFFTLSVGFGVMVTIGSLLRKNSNIPMAGYRMATFDSIISIVIGLLIFPIILIKDNSVSGPELLFRAIPHLLDSSFPAYFFGMLFFLMLYLAALAASVGLMRAVVGNIRELKVKSRSRAIWFSGLACMAASVLPATTKSIFWSALFKKRTLVAGIDMFLINWLLPLGALLMSQLLLYYVDQKLVEREFSLDSHPHARTMYRHWRIILKWVVPPIIIGALILQLIDAVT